MLPYLMLTVMDESDREFIADLYENYSRLMRYKIGKVVHDPWTIDDLLQTTIEKLIVKLPTLRQLDKGRLTNYVANAARNTAFTYLRDRGGDLLDIDEVLAASPHEPEKALIHQEDLEKLSEIWDRLSERSQYFLTSHYLSGMSTQQIAAELGVKQGSVRMSLTRARREALALLEE